MTATRPGFLQVRTDGWAIVISSPHPTGGAELHEPLTPAEARARAEHFERGGRKLQVVDGHRFAQHVLSSDGAAEMARQLRALADALERREPENTMTLGLATETTN